MAETTIEQRCDKASRAIQDLLRPEYSLEEILDALDLLADEIAIQIDGIRDSLATEATMRTAGCR
jgi:hypothetical protein